MESQGKRETKRIKERDRRRGESEAYRELSAVIAAVAKDTVQNQPSRCEQIGIRACLHQQDKPRIQLVKDAMWLIRRLRDDNLHLRSRTAELRFKSENVDTLVGSYKCLRAA